MQTSFNFYHINDICFLFLTEKKDVDVPWKLSDSSRKHTYIILTPLNPTFT